MEQIFSNAQVASKAGNVRSSESMNKSNNQSSETRLTKFDIERREQLSKAVKASRDVKGIFGVEYRTIQKRINAAKNGERALGVVAHGKYYMYAGVTKFPINIYVFVEEEDGGHNVSIEAFSRDWRDWSIERQKFTVQYWQYSNQQEAFEQALGAAMVKYIAKWYDLEKAIVEEEVNLEPVEETVEETANVEEKSAADTLEQALAQSLEDAGDNALNLAYALVEAIEHTDGAVTMHNIEEQALWRAYRAEIENRLASLSRGGDTPAPGLEEKPAETPNDNSGTPAPGLREQVEDMLAADWAQMGDSPLEGYIGEHRVGGGYLLETTRELWQDPFMGVRLVRLGDDHEHFWRIYRDGDIPGVAEDLSKEIHIE